MKLDISEDDYALQTQFANDLANFANEHNVHITLVAHPRKEGDDEKPAGIQGVKGSNGLINQAHNLLSVWRNKPKEAAIQKFSAGEEIVKADESAMKGADALLLIDKQREGDGWVGRVRMTFDAESQQFLDENALPQAVVRFVTDRPYDDRYDEEEIKF